MFDLYLITDPETAGGVAQATAEALADAPGPRVAVQLRAKHLPAAQLLALAYELREITRRAGALLFINDRADIARVVAADGVHLPSTGLPVAAAREAVGPSVLVGVSCHDRASLERAAADGGDFATLSPVFAVPGKGKPLGIAVFGALARGAKLPVYALGGVRADHASALRAHGAHGLAVIRAVWSAEDRRRAVAGCLDALSRPGS